MSRAVAPRKPTVAQRRRAQLQQARLSAPKLCECMPTAQEVRVDLSFDAHERLSHAHCQFVTYPPAQAHFVYACPFGDCDGVYDLNAVVFAMLESHSDRATGVLVCVGNRAQQHPPGTTCGLRASYVVTVNYSPAGASA